MCVSMWIWTAGKLIKYAHLRKFNVMLCGQNFYLFVDCEEKVKKMLFYISRNFAAKRKADSNRGAKLVKWRRNWIIYKFFTVSRGHISPAVQNIIAKRRKMCHIWSLTPNGPHFITVLSLSFSFAAKERVTRTRVHWAKYFIRWHRPCYHVF